MNMYIKEEQISDDLILGYLNGELTSDEKKKLIDWIKLSGDNKKYFDEYSEIWITSKATLKNHRYHPQQGFWKFRQKIEIEDNNTGSKTLILNKIVRYAAIFIVAFSLGGLLFYFTGKSNLSVPELTYNELTVPLGSRVQFLLSDGTTVTLNAGSKLKYDNRYGLTDRVVHLEGEGYFKIAKDAKKPFTVQTSHLNIMALGTEFNVKAYSEDLTIETTLVEGSIQIEEIAQHKAEDVLVLKPNQKLTFLKTDSTMVDEPESKEVPAATLALKPEAEIDNPAIIVCDNINIEPVISWKENRWIFEKQSLSQIAIDLERKFDVQIIFDSEKLKSIRFTGIILAEPIEQVLEVMSISAPINFKVKGRIITLSENKTRTHLNKNLYNR